jgi:hypothetical protein
MANPLLDALLADRSASDPAFPDTAAAPTPEAGARMIDFATALPEAEPLSGDEITFPGEQTAALAPFEEVDSEMESPATPATLPRNPLLDSLLADQQAQAATQQAVAEATTPDQNLPIATPELADALGVLDYRDPQEGARRSQAAALGEILGLPEYEKVKLGAAPVNADGTVTIRRAQAVSPEANAAAAKQLENLRIMAAGEMLVEESPKEVGTLQGIANAAQNAFDSARQALMATDGLDENDASQIARIEYNKAARRVAPGYAAYQQAEGWDAAKAFAKNPFEVTANIITEGLAGSWPALAGGLATGATTALATGAAGSVVPGVGNVIGAGGGFTAGMVGGTAAGSFATEYGSKILEELQTAGMNPKNPESIAKFFSNETLMAEAKDAALKRGVPVAAFDALSAGIAGRVGSVFRAAAKTPVRLAATEGVIQGGLGAGGEISGSLAAGDPVNPKAVFGEVLGEVGPAAIEIAAGRAASASQPAPVGTPSSPTAPPSSAPIAQPAPAEVPQNFTPISSPAPAATSPAPRTLGQVRAPQIANDQTALDEAFGSTFAPPPEVSNDTFAPPAAVNPQVNPAPAPVSDIPAAVSLMRGDKFTDESGQEFQVWKNRQGTIEAHPVIDGKAVVNNASGVRFSATAEAAARNPNDKIFSPATPIPPNTSTAPAAASGAPASTGSPDLITGEGASVSPTSVLPSTETTPAATAPRPFSEIMEENMKRKGEAGYIDFSVVQDFGQSIYQTGMDFAAWSGRMVQKFGETIRDVLSSLWQAVSGGQYLPQARERGSVNISPGTGPKPRKFGQSLQAAPGVAPEVKSRLTSLDYDPVSNAQTLANARARIDSAGSIDTAFTDLMGKPAIEGWQPTAEDYATGMELMAQLQNRSRHADAASIANMMATRATDQGRAIQALSMIGRLGPQGIELFAQSQLQAAATKPAKTDKQKADIQAKITEAGQLQGEVDKLRRDSTTAAIVGNKDLIKSSLPAGVDAVQVNIAIREAILGAPTPLAAQAATSSILTGQGLSDKGAARISGSIVRDFLKTTQDTRATVLQDLLATADSDRRLDKSKLGSLIRLNREGKLTDASLHAGMAKMLGIPHWSAEHSAKVRRILAQHEKATDPRIKLVKAAEALDVVYRDFMPPGFLDKVDTIQTIAMLLNPKTVIRNVVGNTLMAGADLAADTVSVPMDALVSLGTGERTRTGLSLGERLMGLGAGVGDIKAGYDFARSEGRGRIGSIAEGVDTLVRLGRLQSSGKYNASDISALSGPTFTAPVLRQLESTLGLALSITDRGFYESAFRASLDTRMKAAAASGNPMLAPDTDMVTAARMDAGRAIYQDDNAASRTLGGLRRVLNFNQRWGIGSLLMKFTQVPGSILTRAVEFSPLGFINTAYQSLAPMLSSSREFDQKAFTDSFSRALVGTTGLVATGYWLAHLGIISAGSDAKDEDKRNLNRATGWGAYKLNTSALKRALMTGNFWTPQKQQRDDMVIGYDWAQPLSIGVAMGAYSRENQEAIKQDILAGKKQSLAATGLNWLAYAGGAATGAMNSLVEQPLLTGLNQFARDVGYDNIPGAILKTAADAPGTFIPTAARQWMQLTDNAARETRDSSPARQFINELKAQLPGQSQNLPPKYDIAGQPVERWAKDSNTLFNVLFNPSMVSYIKGSPALTEMSQVYKYTAEAGAIPNQVKPEFTVEGVKVRLTSEEISAMQKDMGALSIAALEKFVLSDPRYDKATWDIKAKAMTRALEKASTAAKYRILMSRPDLKTRAKQEYDAIQANRAATQSDMLAPVGP